MNRLNIKIAFVCVSLTFVVSGTAHANSLIADNFEDYMAGPVVGLSSEVLGWESLWTGSNQFIVTNDNNPNEGSQHLEMSPVSDELIYIERKFQPSASTTIYTDVKINRTGGDYMYTIRGDVGIFSGSTQIARVFMRYSEPGIHNHIEILTWDGDSNEWYVVHRIQNNEYYRFGIQFDAENQSGMYRVNVDSGDWSPWLRAMDGALFSSVDKIRLSVSNQDERAVGKMYFDNIKIYSDTESEKEDKDTFELLAELIASVKGYEFEKSQEQSYLAHVVKLEAMMNSADYRGVNNQLEVVKKKLAKDLVKEEIEQSAYDDLVSKIDVLIAKLPEALVLDVPLMTQIESTYPSLTETSAWASALYAGGRASTTGDCGLTIAQCGCAITSLSMIGKHYGQDTGIDGSAVNPLNMNNWLLANDGYTTDGSMLWTYALAYLGEVKNGKGMSRFSLTGFNVEDKATIDTFVDKTGPTIGFNKSKGHYFVLKDLTNVGYFINDPFWYNTKTTDDVRDVAGKVQDYNDVVSKAQLVTHGALTEIPESIEVVLESPAELLITDSRGRRVGYDNETGIIVNEIPGGSYDQEDFILDQQNPAANPHKAKRLMLIKPAGERFELKVIGTGNGEYNLTVAVSDGRGGLTSERVTQATTPGEVDSFTVTTEQGGVDIPVYLKEILAKIPATYQRKFVQAFQVIAGQDAKDHVEVKNVLIENLKRYIETKFEGEGWTVNVIADLEGLIEG